MTNYLSGYNDAIQDCRYMREIASSKDDLKSYIEGLTVVKSEGL